jgi:putative transposase
MVERPEAYRWSSHACNAHGAQDAIVRPHAGYLALCASEAARQVAYRALFAEALAPARIADIRAYVQQQKALGGVQFRAQVEGMLERCMTVRPAHRPSVTRSPIHNGL